MESGRHWGSGSSWDRARVEGTWLRVGQERAAWLRNAMRFCVWGGERKSPQFLGFLTPLLGFSSVSFPGTPPSFLLKGSLPLVTKRAWNSLPCTVDCESSSFSHSVALGEWLLPESFCLVRWSLFWSFGQRQQATGGTFFFFFHLCSLIFQVSGFFSPASEIYEEI